MTTWRRLIQREMAEQNDPGPIIMANVAPNEYWWGRENGIPSLDAEFCNGHGGTDGCAFLAWTDQRVYFPCFYDGAEWAGSAPRQLIAGMTQQHLGG